VIGRSRERREGRRNKEGILKPDASEASTGRGEPGDGVEKKRTVEKKNKVSLQKRESIKPPGMNLKGEQKNRGPPGSVSEGLRNAGGTTVRILQTNIIAALPQKFEEQSPREGRKRAQKKINRAS